MRIKKSVEICAFLTIFNGKHLQFSIYNSRFAVTKMPSTNSAETCNQEFVSLKRSRSANGAQLTKLYNELEKSMMSYNNIEEVKLLNNKLCERFEHFKSVHLQCLDLCAQPEVVADLEANFESCLKNFEEFRERFSQWIAGAIGPHDGENIPVENDAESNVSHGSSRTSVSSRRKLQSAKAKRLIAEHKLKQLKKKQELERARQDLEMKQQLLDQQSELEEAEIEEMAWLETTQEETGVISNNQNAQPDVKNNMTNHIQVNNRTDSVRNITLTQPRPEMNRPCIPEVDSETSSIDRSFQRLASALHEGFNLPKPELLTFDGKPEGYCKFIKNFETNIESRISDNNLKLSYLIQYCTGNCAELSLCNKFKSMSLNDRYKLVRSLKLCYNCLKGKHFTNKCRKPKICNVTNCNVKHHILLHSWVKPDNGHTAVQSSCNCAATEGSTVKNCLGIIPVIVRGGDGSSCQTYALLDDGADKTLCDERLLRSLNITGKPVTFRMSTANSREGIIHGQEADLDIQPIDGNESITLRKVWSVKSLPISTRSAAKYADIRNLPYLSGINIPDIDTNDVMMLIGTDSPIAHIPLEVKFGNSDEPYAIRTRLGWAIRGPVPTTQESNDININFFESRDMLLQQQIERLWTTDFNDKSQQVKSCMSIEDKSAMKSMESTLTREDGHYKIGLSWRDINSSFVNNIPLAQARLQQLKRKLSNDNNLHDMYRTTVNGYIANGYSSDVDYMVPEKTRVWYTPHHPVTNVHNASETDKLNVWLHGPTFLSKGREHWPKYSGNFIPEVSEDDVEVKRYGCIFSCLTSRAVHLEVTHSLSTDSFIAALQRFISRRGLPEKVYSDNGTNLVSGDCELRKSLREWNQSEIGQFMLQREIEWNFNPPSASHMGGIWERMIRSTRAILRSLVKEQLLTDEQLLTVVTEVEKILNDRPITRVSDDPKDPPVLTPSMILLLKSNTCIPRGIFRKEDTYAKRRWRQAQYLADIFWKRWIREYIPTLQSRQKWLRPQRDIREGDIVLVAQENIPRGQWPLGRVVSINVGRDGHTRSCVVKTSMSQFIRPITKLCLLECSI
ncbi:uncharacterized protein LOC132716484 [Ruditapes philippinarum]|uniref:uncharacterized protein LOC132716484 n=1 Tax=Ruditapes philippinarum TaxID=129788 RepID=UPI00295B7FCA|nr:uncharacterized protein LOC132716484 [Ruditapes philippinarum]